MRRKFKKALEVSHKLFDNKNIILLLVKKENALEEADKLKGSNFWPLKCKENTIRYIFRDKNQDNFEIPAGKIVETPSDNIVHAPKTKEEFLKIAIKWLI